MQCKKGGEGEGYHFDLSLRVTFPSSSSNLLIKNTTLLYFIMMKKCLSYVLSSLSWAIENLNDSNFEGESITNTALFSHQPKLCKLHVSLHVVEF